jgi:hypothetical protein
VTYGDTHIGQVKGIRGNKHDYQDYQVPGVVKIDMVNDVKSIFDDFPEEKTDSICPWNGNLFKVETLSPTLSKEKAEQFNTFVAKGLFLCKRPRPDIQPAIAFLYTRVKGPNQGDWFKLKKCLVFSKRQKTKS